jgi:hypothetical protein
LQFTTDDPEDVAIPGQPFSFGTLKRAQALGDFRALQAHGRRVQRVHLAGDLEAGLKHLVEAIEGARATGGRRAR